MFKSKLLRDKDPMLMHNPSHLNLRNKQQHMSYDSLELSFLPFLPGTASAKAQQIPIPQTSSQLPWKHQVEATVLEE